MTKARDLADFLGNNTSLSTINNAYAAGTLVPTVTTTNPSLIINGDFRISQRGTSFVSPGQAVYTLDRWASGMQTTTGAITVTQETDVPTASESGSNFVNSMKIDVTTADTSIAAGDRTSMMYRVEGNDIAFAGFGLAGTRYMTLSFWHKHTKTGTHSVSFTNSDRNRGYPMEYTQTTTDTWEKAELTFPVDTTGSWFTDNRIGMNIYFSIAMGANYSGTANTWAGATIYGTTTTVNNLDSTSNNMLFAGVKLEAGSEATDFQHVSYAEELAKCQRYYQVHNMPQDYSTSDNNNAIYRSYILPVEMRTNGTSTEIDTIRYWRNTTPTTANANVYAGTNLFNTTATGLTEAKGYVGGKFGLDAEL